MRRQFHVVPVDQTHLELIEDMRQCTECELHQNRTQVVVGDYGPKEGICFVGEAPGYNEDKQGRPFVGRSGQLLDEMLDEVGLSREGVSVLNICKCRPPGNRNPTTSEQKTCGGLWLQKQLDYLAPKLVVTLGSVPLGYFHPGARITRQKGEMIVGEKYQIYPMFHPAYVLRGGSTRDAYRQDFEDLVSTLEQLDDDLEIAEVRKQGEQSSLDDFF